MTDQDVNEGAFSNCLTNILQCENQMSCRNALKVLECEYCPRLGGDAILRLFRHGTAAEEKSIMTSSSSSSSRPLDDILISILSNDDYMEMCRERAVTCLKSFLSRMILLAQRDSSSSSSSIGEKVLAYLPLFLEKFIPVCVNRITSVSSQRQDVTQCKRMPSERAEEIRLSLVQIVSLVTKYLADEMGPILVGNLSLDAVISTLCLHLPNSSLLDPYPELKQESCHLIMALCRVFPHCIQRYSESLLTPLVGSAMSKVKESEMKESDAAQSSLLTTEWQFALLRQMVPSSNTLLRHRHSKTRCLALETVNAIMTCLQKPSSSLGPEDIDGTDCGVVVDRMLFQVLPNVETLGPFDKSTSVRIKLIEMVHSQLELFLQDLTDDEIEPSMSWTWILITRLLVLHLICVSDQTEKVRETAIQLGRDVRRNDATCGLDEQGISNIIKRFVNSILNVLLHHIQHGRTTEHKKRYLDAFSSMFTYLNVGTESGLPSCFQSEMKSIISILCHSFGAEERDVYLAAMESATALGSLSDIRKNAAIIILGSMESSDQSNTNNCANDPKECEDEAPCMLLSSPRQIANILRMLSGLCKGMLFSCNDSYHDEVFHELLAITAAITGEKILNSIHEYEDAAFALFDLLKVISLGCKATGISSNKRNATYIDTIHQNVLFCCMHLLGCPYNTNLTTPTQNLIALLCKNPNGAESNAHASSIAGESLERYFPNILKMILRGINDDKKRWTYGSPAMYAFDAFLRISSDKCITTHFDFIAPIFERHLGNGSSNLKGDTNQDYFQMKLFFMALMETVFSNANEPNDNMHEFIERLISNAIIPNLIWQSGGLASSLRKVSIAALFSILSGIGVTKVMLHRLAPTLLPVLKSTLSDDDTSTRELTIAALSKAFQLIPKTLGEDAVKQLYPDLMTGLDDSYQRVRYVTCEALISFLDSSPSKSFQGEVIESIVENLFLHLEDPDLSFQERVCSVLMKASEVDLNSFKRSAKVFLSSQQSYQVTNHPYCYDILRERYNSAP